MKKKNSTERKESGWNYIITMYYIFFNSPVEKLKHSTKKILYSKRRQERINRGTKMNETNEKKK